MPSLKTHCYIDRLMLKHEFPQIHVALDSGSGIAGKRHRELVLHSPLGACVVGGLCAGYSGACSALIHLCVDGVDSGMKRQIRALLNSAERSART